MSSVPEKYIYIETLYDIIDGQRTAIKVFKCTKCGREFGFVGECYEDTLYMFADCDCFCPD